MIDLNPSRKMTARPRPGCLFTLFLLAGFLVTCGPAQTLTVLKNFNANRYNPNGPLVQGPDNALYGTAFVGGTNDFGLVFKVQPDGTGFTVLRRFSGSDGAAPAGGLILSGSTLYGTTFWGGNDDEGTVFALNLSIPLNATVAGGQMVLSWSDPTFSLQAAPTVTGPYQTVDGATSPYANAMTNSQMFFRLQQ
jgi:uncharacterized repeat protein (TIGR03803 family)